MRKTRMTPTYMITFSYHTQNRLWASFQILPNRLHCLPTGPRPEATDIVIDDVFILSGHDMGPEASVCCVQGSMSGLLSAINSS